ncbi:MAG TPA: RluA family pseudouridine synthase [Polyangiaceae bacterium]|nr:RluA family pseudouridine synthase [Polyangiaceae bacterium]
MSKPAESHYVVPRELADAPLDRTLRGWLADKSWNDVRQFISTGKVRVDGRVELDSRTRVQPGQRIEYVANAPRPRAPGVSKSALVYVDSQVVVVEKPAHVSSVAFDENERNTLDEQVARLLAELERQKRPPLGVVHRLDKETTGLLVYARTLPAKRSLKNQFRFHTVKRRYYAICEGHLPSQTLASRLVQDRGDGRRGSTENPELGREAITHVRLLERLAGASLLECRLETGRTHQIRIHLSEVGHPLIGERVYRRNKAEDRQGGGTRVMLHAFELGFEHPSSGKPLHFESPMPEDMAQLYERLRQPRR